MKTLGSTRIKRILCPFDFSTTSLAGLEYAAKLTQVLQASMTVFWVRSSHAPDEAQLYSNQNDLTRGIKRQLRYEVEQIEARFGITPEICIESTVEGSQLSIGEASAVYDLTVIGTNGSDDLHEHIFGSGTHHRLGLAKCPVLLIPPKCSPRMPRRIVYAFDPETNPTHLLTDLESLAIPLHARIQSLYLMPEPGVRETVASPFPEAMIGVHDRWGFDWELDPICSDEVVASIDRHMRRHKNDMLALSCHHRASFERLFQENVIDEFSRMATYPVLVFWH